MQNFIKGLIDKAGIDQATADKVTAYLKENAHRLPDLFKTESAQNLIGKLPTGVQNAIHEATDKLEHATAPQKPKG